jgi:hypothetical protein
VKSTIMSMALAAGVAAAVVFGVASADQTLPAPGPGTGVVTVQGDVSVKGDVKVVNDVNARQSGPWTVGVSGIVNTSPQVLPFVRVGRSYVIQWPDGSVQTIAPRETHGSWARIDSDGKVYWINLAVVHSIQER